MPLTVNQIKKQLAELNITLPSTNSKKEYEKLYNEHFGGGGGGEYSDDDLGGQGYEDLDVSTETLQKVNEMTDGQIYSELIALGQAIGPVQCTTREFYKRKLIKIWNIVGKDAGAETETTNGNGYGHEEIEGEESESYNYSGSTGIEGDGSNGFSSEDSDIEIVSQTEAPAGTRSSPVKKPPTPQRMTTARTITVGMVKDQKAFKATVAPTSEKHEEDYSPSEKWEQYLAKEENRQIHRRATNPTYARTQLFVSATDDGPISAEGNKKVEANEGNGAATLKFLIIMAFLTFGFIYYYFVWKVNSSPVGSFDVVTDEIEEAIRAAQEMKID